MVAIRSLDENGDWEFGKGRQSFKTEQEALKLIIRTRLREWKFDCFFANNNGVDWKNRLSNKNQKRLLDNELRKIIANSTGVVKILKFESSLDSERMYKATFDIQTIYSSVIRIEQSLP
jgi:hypothetical protein